jgi:hypothetical protein
MNIMNSCNAGGTSVGGKGWYGVKATVINMDEIARNM